MKFLLIIAIVLLVVWLFRGNRRVDGGNRASGGPAAGVQQQEMVRCPVCSVHFPRSDALPGADGRLYCCAEHRSRGGG